MSVTLLALQLDRIFECARARQHAAGEVIAFEVGVPLRRVTVSTLVDKYIGETEIYKTEADVYSLSWRRRSSSSYARDLLAGHFPTSSRKRPAASSI